MRWTAVFTHFAPNCHTNYDEAFFLPKHPKQIDALWVLCELICIGRKSTNHYMPRRVIIFRFDIGRRTAPDAVRLSVCTTRPQPSLRAILQFTRHNGIRLNVHLSTIYSVTLLFFLLMSILLHRQATTGKPKLISGPNKWMLCDNDDNFSTTFWFVCFQMVASILGVKCSFTFQSSCFARDECCGREKWKHISDRFYCARMEMELFVFVTDTFDGPFCHSIDMSSRQGRVASSIEHIFGAKWQKDNSFWVQIEIFSGSLSLHRAHDNETLRACARSENIQNHDRVPVNRHFK